ncbi:TPA: hypothetical protein EYP44_02625, partial [Candidatus Bathyarchaeota archaeon]|nr:hypothetical protein [Candidatus Bathyarchaeota archaeon]
MEKCIQVNVLSPTRVKERELVETYRIYYSMVQTLGRSLKDHERIARRELHRRTYSEMREAFQVPSQLAISARVYAWNLRKHRIDRLKRISVRFDRRPFRLAETGRGNPVL